MSHTTLPPTRDQVEQFIANLRRSMLDALDKDTPLCVNREEDWQDVEDGTPLGDKAWMGCTLSVAIGRPAMGA